MISSTPRVPTGLKISDIMDCLVHDIASLCMSQITASMTLQTDVSREISLSLFDFCGKNPGLCNAFIQTPSLYLPLFDKALLKSQSLVAESLQVAVMEKNNRKYRSNAVHLRIDCRGFSSVDAIFTTKAPRSYHVGRFISFKGTVIRTGMCKMVETSKMYQCLKCGSFATAEYDREQYNTIPKPLSCKPSEDGEACNSKKFKVVAQEADFPSSCKDYQEIKVQEQVNKLAVGTIPRSISVILEDDLVDSCKAGDDVTVSGLVIQRWKALSNGDRCEIEVAMYANHVLVHNEQKNSILTDEWAVEFESFWAQNSSTPNYARDLICKSICPKIYGLYFVKLAVLLVLIGGVAKYDQSGVKVRGDPHLLLVGDPGYASKIASRAILTTGIGSTNAGLTVAAVKDSGEWQLEAGALVKEIFIQVLADRGLCCIDEFASIREGDKTVIHEAMEQQTISVAKAGLVCKLNTRCSVLAATNPKGKFDPTQDVSVNIALGSPLLSRFDIILILLDSQNSDWDKTISSFILTAEIKSPPVQTNETNELWPIEKLQAYISYTRSKFSPQMSPESMQILSKYYALQRACDARNAARTTVRLLESLIRLAQAHARLMCRHQVSTFDSVVAVLLAEAGLQGGGIISQGGVLHVGFPEDSEEEAKKMQHVVLDRLGLLELDVEHVSQIHQAPSPRRVFVEESVVESVVDRTIFTVDPTFVDDEPQEYSWDPTQKEVQVSQGQEEIGPAQYFSEDISHELELESRLESQVPTKRKQDQMPTSGRESLARFRFKKQTPVKSIAMEMHEGLVRENEEIGDDLGDLLQGLEEEEPIVKRIGFGTQSTVSVIHPDLRVGNSPRF